MGYYIDRTSKGSLTSPLHKAQQLIADGAVKTDASFKENLVCVVQNGFFDDAGFCFNENEFKVFNDPTDDRRKTWLVYEHAKEFSGYNDKNK